MRLDGKSTKIWHQGEGRVRPGSIPNTATYLHFCGILPLSFSRIACECFFLLWGLIFQTCPCRHWAVWTMGSSPPGMSDTLSESGALRAKTQELFLSMFLKLKRTKENGVFCQLTAMLQDNNFQFFNRDTQQKSCHDSTDNFCLILTCSCQSPGFLFLANPTGASDPSQKFYALFSCEHFSKCITIGLRV